MNLFEIGLRMLLLLCCDCVVNIVGYIFCYVKLVLGRVVVGLCMLLGCLRCWVELRLCFICCWVELLRDCGCCWVRIGLWMLLLLSCR